MPLPFYLAMTAFEYQNCKNLPQHCAWMACHFSSYSDGLTNIPVTLPENSLLIVNDRTPPMGHSDQVILQQLQQVIQQLSVGSVLLDFQIPYREDIANLGNSLLEALPCPVAITPQYAQNWGGPVFLPPVPPYQQIDAYLSPWQGREIWLELDSGCTELTLTENGCSISESDGEYEDYSLTDEALLCHYNIRLTNDRAVFSLARTMEDTETLLEAAEKLGVTHAIGLYQQYGA